MQFRYTLVVLAALLAGCDGSTRREGIAVPLLQVERTDVAGNRVWVLELDALTVYDRTNRRRLRRVILPDWPVAGPGHACAPDLVLDRSGAALISSNVVPVLWRIDPQRFEVRQIFLTLDSDTDKDVGFTALAFAADGTLTAAGASFPSSWRIDLEAATARRVVSPADAPCGTS
jgi:hypothetical protein